MSVPLGAERPAILLDLVDTISHSFTNSFRTGEMTQWLKVFATKPDDLSLVLETHTMEGRRAPAFLIVL